MAAGLRALGRVLHGASQPRFVAGVLAGVTGLVITFLLRVASLGVFLPEVAVDFTVGLIPGSVESFFIRTMGEGAKLLALVVALLVFLVVPGVYALFFRLFQSLLRRRWAVGALYTLGPATIALFLVLPLLGGGFLGTQTPAGPWAAAFSQLLGALLYAAVLDYLLVEVSARYPKGFSLSRRQFIVGAVGAIIAIGAALYGFGALVGRKTRLVFSSVSQMFAKEVTPTEEFYTVTKNVIDPVVDATSWRLMVDGLASHPRTYTYNELLDRADAQEYITMECVSNEVGGELISTAKWGGIPLGEILGEADPLDAADWVLFTSEDDYTVAIPRSKAVEPSTMLALKMNNEPLTVSHGFPARIVVPGLYGMFSAKWLTRITLVQGEYLGFWQAKGWTNQGEIRTTAIIATPPSDSVVEAPVTIGGVAFAGDRGISRVEVSTDGGETWSDAVLKSQTLSNLTWVLWTFQWDPPRSGSYRILARAVDGGGAHQTLTEESPFPNGASGYDAVDLRVFP
ncbi:MAG: molybdopterin-dependent oxidoreductase [Candidatus Thermoplasmatota archaeon]|nr:molybdopterin-dependent oxidoreductase [Candidatus Thermoplasmatota archaeon]